MKVRHTQGFSRVCLCVSGVLQADSEGVVSRRWEAEHRPGSTAAVSLCGEQREELQRHQCHHVGHHAQRYYTCNTLQYTAH